MAKPRTAFSFGMTRYYYSLLLPICVKLLPLIVTTFSVSFTEPLSLSGNRATGSRGKSGDWGLAYLSSSHAFRMRPTERVDRYESDGKLASSWTKTAITGRSCCSFHGGDRFTCPFGNAVTFLRKKRSFEFSKGCRGVRGEFDETTVSEAAVMVGPEEGDIRINGATVPIGSANRSEGSDLTVSNRTECKVPLESAGYRILYPPSMPNQNGILKVDSIHTIYYEEHGRISVETNGSEDTTWSNESNSVSSALKTALFLHGGPGAGCFPNHARFFDPNVYRVVLFDQRGSGRSTPRGEIRNNTLEHLVSDCEALREVLGIQRWDVILGGSWGVTLAIAYAQEFPDRIASLVLRGVCLLRSGEVDWLFSSRGGAASLNSEGWRAFEKAVGVKHEGNATRNESGEDRENGGRTALHAYYDRLLGKDPVLRLGAARSWFQWESGVAASVRGEQWGWTVVSGGMNGTVDNFAERLVLVWEHEAGWSYQDPMGAKLNGSSLDETMFTDASKASEKLRKWSPSPKSSFITSNISSDVIRNMRPVQPAQKYSVLSPHTESLKETNRSMAESFIPAQAMLTCFYSVNERFVMNNRNILSEERIGRIRHIPCICIQGASDGICPPDTALDLLRVWPEMELRIPLSGAHSMYDPAITNEIVKALDRLAKKL